MPEPHVSGPEMRKTDLKRRVRGEVARFSAIRRVIGERTMYSLLFSDGTASALSSGMGKVDS
jgi:hypothetical protein